MDFEPIDADLAETLANAPEEEPRRKSKKKDRFAERTLQNWWELPVNFDKCDYCEHNHMVTMKEDQTVVCRRCYIVGDDLLPSEERAGHEDPSNVIQTNT
jgi:hypothetical protein